MTKNDVKIGASGAAKKAKAGTTKRTRRVKRETLADLREQIAAEDPEFRKAWEALELKRKVVTGLLHLRAKANLTQKELAERAGWDPAFVCRLESFPREGEKLYMPDLKTLMQYAEACDSELSMMFSEPKGRGSDIHIIETLALSASERLQRSMSAFANTEVDIRNRQVRSVQKVATES